VSLAEAGSAPLTISLPLGDGTSAEVPVSDHGELREVLERMSDACADRDVPAPAPVVRLDAGA
jgi:hypothetical protein